MTDGGIGFFRGSVDVIEHGRKVAARRRAVHFLVQSRHNQKMWLARFHWGSILPGRRFMAFFPDGTFLSGVKK
jgi:hypothetical protein